MPGIGKDQRAKGRRWIAQPRLCQRPETERKERLIDESEIGVEKQLPKKAHDDRGKNHRHENRDAVEAKAERLLVKQPREEKPAAILNDHQRDQRLNIVRERVPHNRRHGGAKQHFLEIGKADELAARQPAPLVERVGEGRQDRVDHEQRHEGDRRDDQKRHPGPVPQSACLMRRDGHEFTLKHDRASAAFDRGRQSCGHRSDELERRVTLQKGGGVPAALFEVISGTACSRSRYPC